MVDNLSLDFEFRRLRRAKLKQYRGYKSDGLEVGKMSRTDKLDYLAEGVMEGWYGNDVVQRAILKDLYHPVMERVYILTSKLKGGE